MKIKKEFNHLSAFLIGNPKQFYVQQGNTYCLAESCEGCPHTGSCKSEKESIFAGLIPSSRRGVGFEETRFLVLSLLTDKEFTPEVEGEDNSRKVPMSLWNTPKDNLSLDERNIHFILSDMKKPFRVLKGQFRYYGTKEDFAASEYSKYFSIQNEYIPNHHVVAFDYSAIEPRFSAIYTREPNWISIYDGEPKVIIREITPPETGENKSVLSLKGKKFCILLGESDKENFSEQCAKCKHPCKILKEIKKNVPGDFHSLNAEAFFNNKPDWPKLEPGQKLTKEGKEILKKYRKIAKLCGLAAVYGAAARTLCSYMECSVEEAQAALDNFFSKLSRARQSMITVEQAVYSTGKVANLFSRIRDVRKWVFSQAPTSKQRNMDLQYAIRTGLNHPIQSTAAEALKISMIRITEEIFRNKWSPLYGLDIIQDCSMFTYADFICSMLMSIHDEEDFLIRSDLFDEVLPPIYDILQIRDIIKSLGVDFTLEMDVEYDETRSFTASTKYPSSKIFLYNSVLKENTVKVNPNIYLISLDKVSPEILNRIKSFETVESGMPLYVKNAEGGLFRATQRFSEDFIASLGIEYKKAFLKEA